LLDSDTIEKNKKTPLMQGPNGDKGGRPIGDKTKQQTTQKPARVPKGQTKACLNPNLIDKITLDESEYKIGCEIYDKILTSLENATIKKYGTITEYQEDILIDTIINIIGIFNCFNDVTNQKITQSIKDSMNQATAPAKLDRCVREVTNKSVEKFKKKHGRVPNKKEKRSIVSSAYAICRKSLNM